MENTRNATFTGSSKFAKILSTEDIFMGKDLRKYRIDKGVTQKQVAEISAYKQSHISNVERDKTKIDMALLQDYAKLLNMDISELLLAVVEKYKRYLEEEYDEIPSIKEFLKKEMMANKGFPKKMDEDIASINVVSETLPKEAHKKFMGANNGRGAMPNNAFSGSSKKGG